MKLDSSKGLAILGKIDLLFNWNGNRCSISGLSDFSQLAHCWSWIVFDKKLFLSKNRQACASRRTPLVIGIRPLRSMDGRLVAKKRNLRRSGE
jgi:hypothetical protein